MGHISQLDPSSLARQVLGSRTRVLVCSMKDSVSITACLFIHKSTCRFAVGLEMTGSKETRRKLPLISRDW